MEWPHDPDGDEGSEGGRVYGMAILAKKVDRDDFPLDIDELATEIGHHPIRLDDARVVPAEHIFEAVDVEQVDDLEEFHRAIGRAMREDGYWSYDPTVEVPSTG